MGKVWRIAEREVPIPRGSSVKLQESYGSLPKPYEVGLPATEIGLIALQRRQQKIPGMTRLARKRNVLFTEATVNGVGVGWFTPEKLLPVNTSRLLINLHSGAYVLEKGHAGMREGLALASRLGINVVSVDYRMPPSHPFPAALEDVISVYSALLDTRSPEELIIGGISAGGGLAMAVVHRLNQLNILKPAVLYGVNEWTDLTKTGDSLYTLDGIDKNLGNFEGLLKQAARYYVGDEDTKNPLISPLYGDFQGFPPVILFSGTRDLLLSDSVRAHRKLRSAKVAADLHIYEGMSHGDYNVVPSAPECHDIEGELQNFIDRHVK